MASEHAAMLLQDLHRNCALPGDDRWLDHEDAKHKAQQLSAAIDDADTDAERAQLTSLFFRERGGLLHYLRDSSSADNEVDRNKCREVLLKAFARFIGHARPYVEGRAASALLCAYRIYKQDQNNAVKQAAFEPMEALVRARFPQLPRALEAAGTSMGTILDFLVRDFVVGKKATHSQTLKAKLLKLLAEWASSYPAEVHGARVGEGRGAGVPAAAVVSQHQGSRVRKLQAQCEAELETQYTQWYLSCERGPRSGVKPPEYLLMAGCIQMLGSLCTVYKCDGGESRINKRELFKYFVFTMDRYLNSDFTRYHVLKATLGFLSSHSDVLREVFMPRVEDVLDWLLKLSKHSSREVRNLAFEALGNFVRAVSTALLDDEDDGLDAGKRKAICATFTRRFLDELRLNWASGMPTDEGGDDTAADSHAAEDMAVTAKLATSHGLDSSAMTIFRAVGYFALPIQHFLGTEEVHTGVPGLRGLLQELIDYTRLIFAEETERLQLPNADWFDISSHLAGIANSLAAIVAALPEVDAEVEQHLQRVVMRQLQAFPDLARYQQKANARAIFRLLVNIGSRDFRVAGALTDEFVREALRLAITRKDLYPERDDNGDILQDVAKREVAARDHYVQLFIAVLRPRLATTAETAIDDMQHQADSAAQVPKHAREERLRQRIYDGLMHELLSVLTKLDLTFPELKIEEGQTEDTVQPNNTQDFEFYLATVQCCQAMLPKCAPELFSPWANKFVTTVLDLMGVSPNAHKISGHYKLLNVACAICAAEGYFEAAVCSGVDERKHCRTLLLQLAQQTCVRITQYKDELLVAAVRFVVALPRPLLVECVHELLEPLQLGLRLGLSYKPLAEFVLGTLEGWLVSATDDQCKKALGEERDPFIVGLQRHILPRLLPELNDYLYVSGGRGLLSDDEAIAQNNVQMKRDMTKAYDQQRLATVAAGDDTDALRRRVLRFLGRVGAQVASMAQSETVTTRSTVAEGIVVWDEAEYIQLDLPFGPQAEVPFFLDRLLPRAMELAEGSSDRKTKVTACEFFHAALLLCMATTQQNNDDLEHTIVAQLFPGMLRLSVDSDATVRNMFEPLVPQVVHWYTKPRQEKQKDALLLLDAILDATCHPTDSMLRSRGAAALAEFLKWAIKQSSTSLSVASEHGSSSLHVNSLFHKLCEFARHPDPYKRLGSSLAFTHIYREYREQKMLVKDTAIELLTAYLDSLKISHSDATVLGAATHTLQVLLHLEKIISSDFFIAELSRDRNKGSNLSDKVENFLEKLLEFSCCHINTPASYRNFCANLFYKYLTKYGGDDYNYTPQSYLQDGQYLDRSGRASQKLVELIEGDSSKHNPCEPKCCKLCKSKVSRSTLARIQVSPTISALLTGTNHGWFGKKAMQCTEGIIVCASAYRRLLVEHACNTEQLLLNHNGQPPPSKLRNNLNRWAHSFAQLSAPSGRDEQFQFVSARHLLEETDEAPTVTDARLRSCAKALLGVFKLWCACLDGLANPAHATELFASTDSRLDKNRPSSADQWTAVLVLCMVNPRSMGFLDKDLQVDLQKTVQELCAAIKSTDSVARTFFSSLGKMLSAVHKKGKFNQRSFTLPFRLHRFDLASSQAEEFADVAPVIDNLRTLAEHAPGIAEMLARFSKRVFSNRGQALPDGDVAPTAISTSFSASPCDIEISKAVLRFCLCAGVTCADLVAAMSDQTKPRNANGDERIICVGEVFCSRYQDTVRKQIAAYEARHIGSDVYDDGLSMAAYIQHICTCASRGASHLYDVLLQLIVTSSPNSKRTTVELVMEELNRALSTTMKIAVGSPSVELLDLMNSLVRLDASAVLDCGKTASSSFLDHFVDCLDTKHLEADTPGGLACVTKALALCPWVLSSNATAKHYRKTVFTRLTDICSERITCESDPRELQRSPERAKEFSAYILLLERLLDVLRHCGFIDVLQIFYPLLMQDGHFHMPVILKALETFGMRAAHMESVADCATQFDAVWKEAQDTGLNFALRSKLVDHVCAPMLEWMFVGKAQEAVARHLEQWKRSISEWPLADSGQHLKRNGIIILQTAALAYSCFKAAFQAIGKERCFDYGDGHDQSLIGFVCKAAQKCLSQLPDLPDNDAYSEAKLECSRRAYTAMAELVIRTQTKPALYNLLFSDSVFGNRLWSSLIDIRSNVAPFTAETDFEEQQGKIGELRRGRAISVSTPAPGVSRYLSDSYVAGSSLAMDDAWTALPVPTQNPGNSGDTMDTQQSTQQTQQLQTPPQRPDGAAVAGDVSTVNNESTTEMDTLNRNPCSASIVRVIRRRFELANERVADKQDERDTWLGTHDNRSWIFHFKRSIDTLVRDVTAGHGATNGSDRVLLFLLKVVINLPTEEHFGRYAPHFVRPLALTAAMNGGHNGGKGIHYFVRDICQTLLSWHGLQRGFGSFMLDPQDAHEYDDALRQLVNYLIEHVLSHNIGASTWKKIFVANILLVQDFIEIYGTRMQVRTSLILGHLRGDDPDGEQYMGLQPKIAAKKRMWRHNAGLHFLHICLREGVQLVDQDNVPAELVEGSELWQVYQEVVSLLSHKSVDVWIPAAEVIGLAYWVADNYTPSAAHSVPKAARVGPHGLPWDGTLSHMVLRKIHSFQRQQSKAQDLNRFVTCVYKVAIGDSSSAADGQELRGYPKVTTLSLFWQAVLAALPRLKDDTKVRALMIGATRVSTTLLKPDKPDGRHQSALDTLRDLRPWLGDLIEQRQSSVQSQVLILLQMVFKAFDMPSKPQLCSRADLEQKYDSQELLKCNLPTTDELAEITLDMIPRLITAFVTHRRFEVRKKFFDLLTQLWQYFLPKKREAGRAYVTIQQLIRPALVRGLSDKVEVVRRVVYEFWNHPAQLSESLKTRLPQVLTEVYHQEHEEGWLPVASQLLLHLCTKSTAYDKVVVQSIGATNGAHINIVSSSSTNPLTTPLYCGSQSLLPANMVEATQDLQFEQTQSQAFEVDASEDARFRSIALDTNMSAMSRTHFVRKSSRPSQQLSVAAKRKASSQNDMTQATSGTIDSGFKVPAARNSLAEQMGTSTMVRFSSSRKRQSLQQFRANGSWKRKRANAAEFHTRATKRVRLLRKYRAGELPDLRVTVKDIVEPMRELSLHDRQFSCQLMDLLFDAILTKRTVTQHGSQDRAASSFMNNVFGRDRIAKNDFHMTMHNALCTMLRRTRASSSTFTGWLLRMFQRGVGAQDPCELMSQPEVTLPLQQVVVLLGQISLRGRCYHSGVQALEAIKLQVQSCRLAAQKDLRDRASREEDNSIIQRFDGNAMQARAQVSMMTDDSLGPSRLLDPDGCDALLRQLTSQLSQVYTALGEKDTVHAIASACEDADGIVHDRQLDLIGQALTDEAGCAFDAALSKYREVKSISATLDAGLVPHQCRQGLLECFMRLQQWDSVAEEAQEALQALDDNASQFERSAFWDYLCQGCMQAEARSPDGSPSPQERRWELLRKMMDTDDQCRRHFEASSQLELATLALHSDDHPRASFLVDSFYETFASEWSGLHKLASTARLQKLQKLQYAVEIEETIDSYASLNHISTESGRASSPLRGMIKTWCTRLPSPTMDAVIQWSQLVSARCGHLRLLKQRLKDHTDADVDEVQWAHQTFSQIEGAEKHLYRRLITVAIEQKDASIYKTDGKEGRVEGRVGVIIHQNFAVDDCRLEKMQLFVLQNLAELSGEERLQKLSIGLESCSRRIDQGDYGEATGEAWLVRAQICNEMATASHSLQCATDAMGNEAAWQAKREEHRDQNWQVQAALLSFERAAENLVASSRIAQVHCECADFCHRAMQCKWYACASERENLAGQMVTSLLHAMSLDARAANMAFPRALACLRQSNAARQALRSLAPTVPSRMFLAWTCQMVSLVNQGDNPETEAVVPILAQLARDFPAAVYYPVNLSQSEFDAAAQRKISPVMHTLQKVAAGLQQFVRAVELLANPWDRAISWIKLAKRAYHTSDETKYKQAMQSLLDDCFDAHAQNLGDVNLRFAQCKHVASNTAGQKAAINLNVACKRLHKLASGAVTGQIPVMQAEITSMSKTFNAAMKDYVEHEQRSHSKDWTTPKVTDFTTFFSSVRDHKVELPGSWEHQSQPHEVTTSPRLLLQGVQHRMKRFSTLHSPKVVTFYGSDLKEYAMLAKAGEDLRLDQRLQQMYGVMNQQLREDVDARRRQLRIRTFGVTPTSQQAGLVQMVRCTKDYADVIDAGHAAVRGSKLPRCSVFDKVVYDKGLLKRPPETAAALFNKAVAQTPKHLLREYLLRVATSAEAFLAMRSNFLKTLATFSIAGYITGVGDRHTHNFLVDTSDGSVVGIDFGQSFAVPLQLKVPELSPFRLSPQMRDCLAPLDGIAQFTHTMVHTLRVLRANADVLNSILDVFLNEPLLDWAEQAYNTHKKEIVSAESLDHHRQRFAEQSLDACRAKLAGKNPVTVILQQLSRSPHSETGIHGAHEGTWQQHIATAEGGATRRRQRDDVRGVDQLDVYKQVEVLIDMATDPAVVGRMWRGGAYWL